MPRYFFDTDDGDRLCSDDQGLDLPDLNAVRNEAVDALPDMAPQKLPDGDRRSFSVSVRDEAGTVVYTAMLELRGTWKVTPPT